MPKLSVTKEFTFDAAHFLTDYYGKCERLHGHTYKLQVTISGDIGSNGLLIDFVILKAIVKDAVLSDFDHAHLNEIVKNPTSELLAQEIWRRLENLDQLLAKQIDNKNLCTELKNYLKDNSLTAQNIGENLPQNLKLEAITLWETPTSFVTLTR